MDFVSRVALVDISDHLLVICMLDRKISSCHKNYTVGDDNNFVYQYIRHQMSMLVIGPIS